MWLSVCLLLETPVCRLTSVVIMWHDQPWLTHWTDTNHLLVLSVFSVLTGLDVVWDSPSDINGVDDWNLTRGDHWVLLQMCITLGGNTLSVSLSASLSLFCLYCTESTLKQRLFFFVSRQLSPADWPQPACHHHQAGGILPVPVCLQGFS